MRTAIVALIFPGLPFLMCLPPDDDGVACTEIFVYGVNATVTDADTGEPVSGATLVLSEGDFSEEMMELSAGEYVGAGERAGTYTLTVTVDGFEPQTLDEIIVEADACHVLPVTRDITLTPQ